MYIMSQDGTRIERLVSVAIDHYGPHDSAYRITHRAFDARSDIIATYPTEPAAKLQLIGIVRALNEGRLIYCFD